MIVIGRKAIDSTVPLRERIVRLIHCAGRDQREAGEAMLEILSGEGKSFFTSREEEEFSLQVWGWEQRDAYLALCFWREILNAIDRADTIDREWFERDLVPAHHPVGQLAPVRMTKEQVREVLAMSSQPGKVLPMPLADRVIVLERRVAALEAHAAATEAMLEIEQHR